MKFREVEKKLLADGWHQVSQKRGGQPSPIQASDEARESYST